MKQLYIILLLAAVYIFFQQPLSAQTAPSTKYVRLDIGHGGLHCPFLGIKIEGMLKEIQDVSSLKIYKRESYATFELPASTPLSESDIKQIGIKAGYPPDDVSVVVSDSAPVNQE